VPENTTALFSMVTRHARIIARKRIDGPFAF